MEQTQSFSETKTRLEGRINELDSERNSLAIQIPILKERLTSLRLEEKARSLQTEISALHSEKALIEEEISRFHAVSVDETSDSSSNPTSSSFSTTNDNENAGNKLGEESNQTKEGISLVENQAI